MKKQAAAAEEQSVKSFAVVQFSYLKTRRLPGLGVPPAVQCLL